MIIRNGKNWVCQLGDCVQLLRDLPDESVDMILTDPPYSSGGQFRGDRVQSTNKKYVHKDSGEYNQRPDFGGDNRDQRAFAYWGHLWMTEALRVIKPGCIMYTFADWRQVPTVTDMIQGAGWVWRGIIPWDKTEGARPTLGRPRSQAEYAIWGSRGPMPALKKGEDGAVAMAGVFYVDEDTHGMGFGGMEQLIEMEPIIRAARRPEDRIHITGKPVSLCENLMKVAPANGLVLDPFTGAGSTGLAALRTGRQFMGFELVPEIFNIACERLAAVDPEEKAA